MQFQNQTNFYQGKVRDVYTINHKFVVMLASNRISAFDVVLPKPIPYKGQVLNQLAQHFLEATADIVPNWLLKSIAPNASIGLHCNPFPVEMVIRGYLSGHAWRTYKSGERLICGVQMPDGMRENDKFPTPIITPTTKAHEGHDMDISREEILKQNIVSEADYVALENYTQALFARGTQMADAQGLILVDTKYEFGKIGDTIYLIDEIHTPDSSRYFYADTYAANQAAGIPQKQLSKEFVREWLIANNFQGLEGQTIPEITDAFATEISDRYILLYEKVSGKKFIKTTLEYAALQSAIEDALAKIIADAK
jgi:phosphoribosylaminoimidazole-succinocarboxamide synthase